MDVKHHCYLPLLLLLLCIDQPMQLSLLPSINPKVDYLAVIAVVNDQPKVGFLALGS